ncbi:histidinol dehydrogenase [Leptotrichia sp. oral taxon 847]|uniref:histidinol dehydrogenase n=1 Tax=Leptotrichia sp. oral taxon 847 TaxID=1785996 RepID=UPI000768452C|nr:histidinol dehydrogenase [Leptotrichia sp. oral taxon 847]AMD94173.1 histidinol dehydrogenase [Leptotrichia sp. oral taxon 847]
MIKTIEYSENLNFEKELARSQFSYDDVNETVENILKDVKKRGDKALFEYTKKFDKVDLKTLEVSEKEIQKAFDTIDKELLEVIKYSHDNIKLFHERQVRNNLIVKKENGISLGQIINPIEKVGLYVPGGTAAYPSTVLMNAVPAKIAGCKEIIMVTPPTSDGTILPSLLVAAKIAGVDRIFKVGGAQSIAALSYGTESIPKVYKIVGPGNIYVAMAKKMVYGEVSIDMIAGPSEVLIIADDSANPVHVAADLLSQAEHDKLAASILVTTSKELAKNVAEQLEIQLKELEREEIARTSIENQGRIIITETIDEAIKISNEIAPEHLELAVSNPFELLTRVKNAGSIFMGHNTPEPLGDYLAGPNHTLPTSGTAKFSSPLSVDDFIKKSSFIYYSKEGLEEVKDKVIKFAESEGLTAHARSVSKRFEK